MALAASPKEAVYDLEIRPGVAFQPKDYDTHGRIATTLFRFHR
jgi:hypothetical protein